jgi:hypothetical protein
MTADITFHYPPELFNLLVDTIPVLNRSKKDVLLFFRGAGVSGDLVDETSPNGSNPLPRNSTNTRWSAPFLTD